MCSSRREVALRGALLRLALCVAPHAAVIFPAPHVPPSQFPLCSALRVARPQSAAWYHQGDSLSCEARQSQRRLHDRDLDRSDLRDGVEAAGEEALAPLLPVFLARITVLVAVRCDAFVWARRTAHGQHVAPRRRWRQRRRLQRRRRRRRRGRCQRATRGRARLGVSVEVDRGCCVRKGYSCCERGSCG